MAIAQGAVRKSSRIAGLAWLALTYLTPCAALEDSPSPPRRPCRSLPGSRARAIKASFSGSDIRGGAPSHRRREGEPQAPQRCQLPAFRSASMQGGVSEIVSLRPTFLSLGTHRLPDFLAVLSHRGNAHRAHRSSKGKRIAHGAGRQRRPRGLRENPRRSGDQLRQHDVFSTFAPKDAAKALDDGAVDAVFLNLSLGFRPSFDVLAGGARNTA